MVIPQISYPQEKALSLERFREMDYFAVNQYDLPIELMMENAGLQLANLIVHFADKSQSILIGIGNGNNGGGGLVAARRLAAWGYAVQLDIFTPITKELPLKQLKRAIKFGVIDQPTTKADVWVDAYLGFSQRLPLSEDLLARIALANSSSNLRISLDIPTGFLGDTKQAYFKAHHVLSLAAPKQILFHLPSSTKTYIADLGIPKPVYQRFGVDIFDFPNSNIIEIGACPLLK